MDNTVIRYIFPFFCLVSVICDYPSLKKKKESNSNYKKKKIVFWSVSRIPLKPLDNIWPMSWINDQKRSKNNSSEKKSTSLAWLIKKYHLWFLFSWKVHKGKKKTKNKQTNKQRLKSNIPFVERYWIHCHHGGRWTHELSYQSQGLILQVLHLRYHWSQLDLVRNNSKTFKIV